MSDRSRLRLVVLRVLVVSILLTLLGRLAYLQVEQGAAYRNAASANRVRSVVTPAARGMVLDDRGVPLISNRTALVVSVNRSVLRTAPHRGREVLQRLATIIGVPVAELTSAITPCGERLADGTRVSPKECWNGSPYQPVPVKEYASERADETDRVLTIEEHAEDFTGVTATYQAVRQYPQKSLASHALGYLGPLTKDNLADPKYKALPAGSQIGRVGLEAAYDDPLRGTSGVQKLVVDKDGNVTGTLDTVDARAGDDLVLSLDAGVQKVAEDALQAGILRARGQYDKTNNRNYVAPNGAVVVQEVDTGRIVAMASYPSYDPTLFVGKVLTKDYVALRDAPGKPLISNATQGLFAPGSTFKIVSTAAAVAAGSSINGYFPCPSEITFGNKTFHNFEGESTSANIDFRTTLIKSCDTVYYQLAYDEWVRDGGPQGNARPRESFPKMARAWGFGSRTGVDLPDELRGLITDRGYKQRYWAQAKGDYCAGAKRRVKGTYLQQLDQEFCTDGYRYNAGDAVNFAIGQGDVLVTPLQLTSAYSALANGGTLYAPRLAKGLLSADGRTVTPIPPVRTGRLPVSPQVLAYMSSALTGVPEQGGTAQEAFKKFPFGRLQIAGKTGTADVRGKSPTSWFASFAPAAAPKYAVVVMVPEAGTGGTTAAPIARAIYDGMYGLEGRRGVLGNGLPTALPVVRGDGSIAPPGTRVQLPPRVLKPKPAPSPTPGVSALGQLPFADLPRRRPAGGGR